MQGPHQKWQEQASATAALVTCGGYAARCDEDDPGAVSHAGQERPGHQRCLQAQRATAWAPGPFLFQKIPCVWCIFKQLGNIRDTEGIQNDKHLCALYSASEIKCFLYGSSPEYPSLTQTSSLLLSNHHPKVTLSSLFIFVTSIIYAYITKNIWFYTCHMKLGWWHIVCIPLVILLILYVRFIQAQECRRYLHLHGCQDSFQWTQVTRAMEAWWKQNLTPFGEMLKSGFTRFLRLNSE